MKQSLSKLISVALFVIFIFICVIYYNTQHINTKTIKDETFFEPFIPYLDTIPIPKPYIRSNKVDTLTVQPEIIKFGLHSTSFTETE